MRFYTHFQLYRNVIYIRGYENGKRFQDRINYRPYLFVPTTKPSDYKTIDGQSLGKIKFDSIREAKDFAKKYEDIDNFKVYGSTDYAYTYVYDAFPQELEFDVGTISIGYIDIETAKQDGGINPTNPNAEITAISIRKNGITYVLGYGDYKPHAPNIHYLKCANEKELLNNFINIWVSLDLDVISGWNVEFFDIPYIINRITMILGEDSAKLLSPWNILEEKEIVIRGRPNQAYTPMGITILDYQHIYKKFSFTNSEDWKLNTIAHKELKVKKIDYSEYEDIFDLYVKNFQKFIEYNVTDVDLVEKLEEKCKFIELVLYLAYDAKVTYTDTLSTVKPWDIIIHNYLMDNNICVPPKESKHMPRELVGGYVKEIKPGMYKWVVSFDFDSLYPHIIMLLNIGNDTFQGKGYAPGWSIDKALEGSMSSVEWPLDDISNSCRGVNLTLFDKSRESFFSYLMRTKYQDRKKFKNMAGDYKKQAAKETDPEKKNQLVNLAAKFNGLQLARKIQLNSAYGAMSNLWFRWFDLDCAEAITMTGQMAIRWVENAVNRALNNAIGGKSKDRVIASDTDSVYITLDDIVSKYFNENDPDYEIDKVVNFVDKICKQMLQPVINDACKEMYNYLNVRVEALSMKRETIADRALWVAAKNYMLNAWDIEGLRFTEPELKVTGIKAVMPSTPAVVRESMKETFKIIMNKNENDLHEYILKFREEFRSRPFDQIAMPRGVKGVELYHDPKTLYKSKTPIHVRASLVYNKLIQDRGLSNTYEKIYSGDKIKFGYLKVPNPAKENVIAILNNLPPELCMEDYIDYDLQFSKTYLSPLTDILNIIGWSPEKRSTLEDWF